MGQDQLTLAWYVLHTRSRFENVVNDALIKKRVDAFLPKITVKSQRQDRHRMLRVPMFPGYVFVRTDLSPTRHIDILKTVGAVRLIGNTRGPVPVSDTTIESLRIMTGSDEDIITGARFKRGDRVMVINGPFSGVIGIFSHYRGNDRVIVNIDVLGKFAAVHVDAADVERMPEILS